MFRLLRKYGVRPTPRDREALEGAASVAAMMSDVRVLEHLISFKVNLNAYDEEGRTPLSVLCMSGDMDDVGESEDSGRVPALKLMLRAGANPNLRDKDKEFPLSWAVFSDKDALAKALLEGGADPNIRDEFGRTSFARLFETLGQPYRSPVDSTICQLLLKHGADVNLQDNQGRSALMSAAHSGDSKAIDFLLSRGAKVNATDKKSTTALMIAADRGNVEVTKRLLTAGADARLKDKAGKTALDYTQGPIVDYAIVAPSGSTAQ